MTDDTPVATPLGDTGERYRYDAEAFAKLLCEIARLEAEITALRPPVDTIIPQYDQWHKGRDWWSITCGECGHRMGMGIAAPRPTEFVGELSEAEVRQTLLSDGIVDDAGYSSGALDNLVKHILALMPETYKPGDVFPVTKAMVEAGQEAWDKVAAFEGHLDGGDLTAIYLAMQRVAPKVDLAPWPGASTVREVLPVIQKAVRLADTGRTNTAERETLKAAFAALTAVRIATKVPIK